jgi:hypothetical protein
MQKGRGNRKNIGGTWSTRSESAYKHSTRTNNINATNNQTSLNNKFNALFDGSAIYNKIIQQSLELEGKDNLYYLVYNLIFITYKKEKGKAALISKRIEKSTTEGSNIELNDPSSPDGRYLVRFISASESSQGSHVICVVKTGNKCVVYDSNDSCGGQYAWVGTEIFVSQLKSTYEVISGYGSRKNKPMQYNICTLFALYVWLIGEVPENDKTENAKIYQKEYTMRLLTEFMIKLEQLKLSTLKEHIENYIKDTTTFD